MYTTALVLLFIIKKRQFMNSYLKKDDQSLVIVRQVTITYSIDLRDNS